MLRRILLASLAGVPLLAFPISGRADETPLSVVASFSILGDMVKEIGGDHVAVTTLVGPNGDAHVYEPTTADAKTLASTQLLVTNGLGLEKWLPRLLSASGFAGATVVASEGVEPREMAEGSEEASNATGGHGDDEGRLDPHAWQDLANGVLYARNIEMGLVEADPAHANDYRAAAESYTRQLEDLNTEVKAKFAQIPADRRTIVTTHDAFGYFAAAYGLTLIAPEGMSTEAEASAADVADIVDQIRRQHIKAVFIENISNTKLMDQIARETGAVIGGELYSDALSPPDGPAPTYVKMFQWNTQQLTEALMGS